MSSECRHSLLTDAGRVTVVRAFAASSAERAAALRPGKARSLLAGLCHHGPAGDRQSLVRLHALAYGDPVTRGWDTTHDHLIPLVLEAVEEGRVLLIPAGRAARGFSQDGLRPTDRAEQIASGLARLRGAIALDGTSYRVVSAAGWRAEEGGGENWEVVNEGIARAVLERWLSTASAGEAPLLREAAGRLADTRSVHVREGLFVLRRASIRRMDTQREAEPAISPSQLRKQKADDWVELVLLDEDGQPLQTPLEVVLSDGRKERVTPDASGLVRFSALVPGQCQVTVVKLQPAA